MNTNYSPLDQQFTIVLGKSMLLVSGAVECGYPWQFSLITSVVMIIFLWLFAQFYIQAYLSKTKSNGASVTLANGKLKSS